MRSSNSLIDLLDHLAHDKLIVYLQRLLQEARASLLLEHRKADENISPEENQPKCYSTRLSIDIALLQSRGVTLRVAVQDYIQFRLAELKNARSYERWSLHQTVRHYILSLPGEHHQFPQSENLNRRVPLAEAH